MADRVYSAEELKAADAAFSAPTGTTVTVGVPTSAESGGDKAEAWRTKWKVAIDGVDLTDKMHPYLQSIEVQDKDGTTGDDCTLVLDDSKAQIKMPSAGGLIKVALNDADVFEGTIDEIRYTLARGQGSIITVRAKGFNATTSSKVKAPIDFHKDDCTMQEFMDEAAKRAGLQAVKLDPVFADIRRDYWAADRESFLHLGERLARDHGASFKIRGDRAVFAQRGSGMTPSGKPLPSLTVERGKNLEHLDIAPFIGRPRYTKARTKWYDHKKAKFEHKDIEIEQKSASDYSPADQAKIQAAFDAPDDGATTAARTYSPEEMAAINGAFNSTGGGDPAGFASWEVSLIQSALTSPLATAARLATSIAASAGAALADAAAAGAASAISGSVGTRTYSPEEQSAIQAAFDEPVAPAAGERTYSKEDMAKIKAAFDEGETIALVNHSVHDKDAATKTGGGKKTKSSRESGEGSVVVPLNPQAKVEGTLIIKGVRPGVDGPYRISGVTHKVERGSGGTTTIELKQPGSGTGRAGDNRSAGDFDREKYIAEQGRVAAAGKARDAVVAGAPNAPT